MSAPLYNGGLIGAIDDQGRPYVLDDGNWSLQGQPPGEGPAYRALALYVNGNEAYGYRPTFKREPFTSALDRPGVFTRENLLRWLGPILAPQSKVEMILTGGNHHYYGPLGDDSGDWMEWASLNPTTLESVVATTGVLTVPNGVPPKHDDLDVIEQLAEMCDNVTVEMTLMTAHNRDAYKRDNPKEVEALVDYLLDYVFRQSTPPPELRTHAGRAASGMLQNAILCQEQL